MLKLDGRLGEVFKILYQVKDNIKKDRWLDGPWLYEPDIMKLLHRPTGYLCQVRRVEFSGALCGYVEFKSDHILHGWDTVEETFSGNPAHWGITFSQPHSPLRKRKKRWSIGFDTAHCNDFMPGMESYLGEAHELAKLKFPNVKIPKIRSLSIAGRSKDYKDIYYVLKNIDELAVWSEQQNKQMNALTSGEKINVQ